MISRTDLSKTTPSAASLRQRRHLSVYHRALRSANTPAERAAVAARYRRLFDVGHEVSAGARVLDGSAEDVSVVSREGVGGSSTGSVEDVSVVSREGVGGSSTGSVEDLTVTAAA